MRTFIKIILTIAILMIGTPIFEVVKNTPILKIALMAGLLAGIVAIWKYKPGKENNPSDKQQLNK